MLRAIQGHVGSRFRLSDSVSLARLFVLRRTRTHLAKLDDHMLKDIGLTRAQAETEAARKLWDAPAHWLE